MHFPSSFFQGIGLAFLSYASLLNAAVNSPEDGQAPLVKVRHPTNGNCFEAGVTLKNCFTSIAALNNWINNTRKPNSSKPLLVDIGPGSFNVGLQLTCSSQDSINNITFRGSGRDRTVISMAAATGAGFSNFGCGDISVEHLTLRGGTWGVAWQGTGNSNWNDVTVTGGKYGWVEDFALFGSCTNGKVGSHYWFSSRIVGEAPEGSTESAVGYFSPCGNNWFFASEITGKGGPNGSQPTSALILPFIANGSKTEAHFYGSVVRAIATTTGFTAPSIGGGLVALRAAGNASIHSHGTGIDVTGFGDSDIGGAVAADGAELHLNESAYNMSPGGSGKIVRIINGGGTPAPHIHAPYLWEPHDTPPNVVSINGADMVIQTKCAATGCRTAGTETHLLISNNNCTGVGGPWFDVVTKQCR